MGNIVVSNLGKAYKKYPTRWSRFLEWITPGGRNHHELKWVLQDINFTIQPGEAVGIIGVNGAGKSTLLKLITGTTQPTTGSVQMTGRVAAMLELGMGFHPDFTGRQNVYMSGQLLGMTSDDITRLMPEIEAFADIGEYIDMPVRVYSSGMQMRLAFSVATAIRPDILIVDEALSVGDAYFQHKSFERIRKFRELGTTLLIVSHDKQAIQSICDTAILLGQGKVLLHADPESVFDLYNASIVGDKNQKISQHKDLSGKLKTISGSGKASVINLRLLNEAEEDLKVVNVGQNVILRARVLVRDELPRLVFGYAIKDRLGQVLYGTNTFLQSKVLQNLKAGQCIEYDFSFPMNLGVGSYSFQTALHSDINHLSENFEWIDLAHTFEVINLDMPHFEGVLWIDPAIRIRMNDGIL